VEKSQKDREKRRIGGDSERREEEPAMSYHWNSSSGELLKLGITKTSGTRTGKQTIRDHPRLREKEIRARTREAPSAKRNSKKKQTGRKREEGERGQTG